MRTCRLGRDYLRRDGSSASDRIRWAASVSCRIESFALLADRVDHCLENRSNPRHSFVPHKSPEWEYNHPLPVSPVRYRCLVSKSTTATHYGTHAYPQWPRQTLSSVRPMYSLFRPTFGRPMEITVVGIKPPRRVSLWSIVAEAPAP